MVLTCVGGVGKVAAARAAEALLRLGARRALLVVGMVLLATPPLSAQSFEMNFFVAIEGPTWGADRGAIDVGREGPWARTTRSVRRRGR